MWRLILVTFGFLAFGFYELSGGADYQPREGSRQHAAVAGMTAQRVTHSASVSNPVIVHRNGETATTAGDAKVVLASAPGSDRSGVRMVLQPSQPERTDKPFTTGVTTVAADPGKIARLVAAATTSAATPEPDTSGASAREPLSGADLRQVKGARVNMRSGPDTGYDIVTKLTRGEEVEVLSDNGDGWVELRVLDTGRIGWVADFLLVAAN